MDKNVLKESEDMSDYTVEVYRVDRRTKSGRRFVRKFDCSDMTREEVVLSVESAYPDRDAFVYFVHETYVVKKNFMTGEEYKERYDIPYHCSPSSESYWSM